MGKDKKKKKKKEKSKSKGTSDVHSQKAFKTGKAAHQVAGMPPGVSIENPVDRSGDALFLGTDYREINSWHYNRPWSEILADIQLWRPLPFTHGIEMELIIADDTGNIHQEMRWFSG